MKKNFGIIYVMLIIVSTLFLTGCNQNDSEISTDVVNDSQLFYGKLITLSDFPKDKVISPEYMDKVNVSIESGDVGDSPENALVALTFDKDLVLYTPKRYNSELNKESLAEITEYLTDINTFKKVTGLEEATADYAQSMTNSEGQEIWVFDAYVKYFKTREEKKKEVIKKLQTISLQRVSSSVLPSAPSWGRLGNIIYARWDAILSVSNYTGHTGGVTTEVLASYPTKVLQMYNTYTTEALSPSSGTLTRRMTNSAGTTAWNSSIIFDRYALWLSSLTTSQRTNIASYQTAQAGEPYYFSILASEKERTDRWYCSKLQWRAYKEKAGIDIDKDQGGCVFPDDILENDALVSEPFGLVS